MKTRRTFPILLTAGIGAQTRAVDTSWDDGDAIGISCTSTGSTNYTNMKYATAKGGTSGAFSYDGINNGIFFKDNEDVTFSAYYPFTEADKIVDGVITVNTTDQTKSKDFDFLFDDGVTTSLANVANNAVPVNFNFKHKMCKLVLKIKTDATAGFAATDVTTGTYYWNYFTHDGTFNPTTGQAKKTGAYNDNWPINATPADGADNVRTYAMILFPQSIQGQFKATINGADYTSSMMDCNFMAGNSYEYTITIKKTGVEVSGCTISKWGTGGTGAGSVEIVEPVDLTAYTGEIYTVPQNASVVLDGKGQSLNKQLVIGARRNRNAEECSSSANSNGEWCYL